MTTLQTKTVVLFASKLGYQTRSFEAAARKLGVELVYVTDRCHELDDPWGDHAIAARFANPEEAAATAIQSLRGKPIAAILALGDAPAVAASYTARGLGLRANHPAAVEACHNKLRTREVFRDAGLFNPPTGLWFRTIPLSPEPEPSLLGIQYPCVLKPLSLSASQGVMRANTHEEFREAARRLARLLERPDLQTKSASPYREALVEEYIPGVEVAVEGILLDGELKILAIFDKPDPLEGPYFEETIYVAPSRLSAEQQSAIIRTASQSIRALGLSHGPVHAEFRINDRGVWPIEVAPRPIGGMCAASLSFVSTRNPIMDDIREGTASAVPKGSDNAGALAPEVSVATGTQIALTEQTLPHDLQPIGLEELILRHAIGEDISAWQREPAASAVMMIPVPASGILEKVGGIAEAQRVANVTDVQITARLHDQIQAWPEGSSYLGFIFAKAESPAAAEQAVREAHSKLTFQIRPTLPVEHPITGKVLDPRN
jgi:formate-dependent phosphoribosylglycinamide formyltransferase (GAR transformylase)